MSDQERLLSEFASLTESAIADVLRHLEEKYEWVETKEESVSLMSRFRGILIASLCGELEELLGMKFMKLVPQLSDKADKKTSKFTHENFPDDSSLKGRAQTMWAIRIAFTHGNGLISQIDDAQVAGYLPGKHLKGINIVDDKIILERQVTFPSVRTAVEILEKFK